MMSWGRTSLKIYMLFNSIPFRIIWKHVLEKHKRETLINSKKYAAYHLTLFNHREENLCMISNQAPFDIHTNYLSLYLLDGCRSFWVKSAIRYSQLSEEDWRHHKRYGSKHFYEDMNRRSSSVFEWISHAAQLEHITVTTKILDIICHQTNYILSSTRAKRMQ